MRTLKVVFIHQNFELGQAVIKVLTRARFSVSSAAGATDGLRVVYAVRPDVILLQLAADAEETWETLAQFRMFTQAPAYILAAAPTEQDCARGLALRVSGFVAPTGLDDLVTKLVTLRNSVCAAKPVKQRRTQNPSHPALGMNPVQMTTDKRRNVH